MERSAVVEKTVPTFVKWEEVFSMNHRGRREVRYFLKRRDGTSDLAVVGKEKKFGHDGKISSSSSYRYRYAIRENSLFRSSNMPFEISSKLRSRRQVIDWLSSLVTDGSFSRPPQPTDGIMGAGNTLEKFQDVQLQKTSHQTTEFLWVGSAWTCRKKRNHYEAYTRGGVRISVHDFVYVLAEENKRLVAYLEDLYEDSRGNKMAVVRWFHKVDEVGLDLPHTYNDKEIFFSLCIQDLSIECIDGLATVLSPNHYHNFLKLVASSHTKFNPFVCQHQFEDEVVKPFDITQVKGYWNQIVHKFMSRDEIGVRPNKRLRRLVDEDGCGQKDTYKIGCEIEVLCQDSGIRGVWFKGVVIKKHKDKIKVRYQDIKDAADESRNLEEWILSSRVAAFDELGIRDNGRTTIRPSRITENDTSLFNVGCIVDAWLHDGWWEGIIIHKESNDKIHIYFPWEKQKSVLGLKDLRLSQEWIKNEWKKIKNRPDLVSSISSCPKQTKSHDNGSVHDKEESLGYEDTVSKYYYSKEYIIANLKWNWSTKERHGRNSSKRLQGNCKNKLFTVKLRKNGDSSLYCRAVAPPLTSLVMSR